MGTLHRLPTPADRQAEARATLAKCERAWRDVQVEADKLREQLLALEPLERAAHAAYVDALNACSPARSAEVAAELTLWLPGGV